MKPRIQESIHPELAVRGSMHRAGLRVGLHVKFSGKPDVVSVHDCFWHQHPKCKYAYMPTSRIDFWQNKLTKNVERDLKAQQALINLRWRVVAIWKCHTKNRDLLRLEIQNAFNV
ncbi:very short patch repair endonuclease [Pseudomonas sp. GW460-R15]|nr:very short patch repair endonuclease [Pseudomonas sp. GW456-R21]POA66433.1 very short patch repair endonuclease [Pseudomonas sp. GW460-R15]